MRLITTVLIALFLSTNLFAASFSKVSTSKLKSPVLKKLASYSYDLTNAVDYEHEVLEMAAFKVRPSSKQSKSKMVKQLMYVYLLKTELWEDIEFGSDDYDEVDVDLVTSKDFRDTLRRRASGIEYLLRAYNYQGRDGLDNYDEEDDEYQNIVKAFDKLLYAVKKTLSYKNISVYFTFLSVERGCDVSSYGVVYYDSKTKELLSVATGRNNH